MLVFDWLRSLCRGIWNILNKLWHAIFEEEPEVVCMYTVPKKIIGGYYWAGSSTAINPALELNPGILTHIYFAFLEVQEDGTLEFQNSQLSQPQLAQHLHDFKQKFNPNLKLLFSVISKKNSFSVVVADGQKRNVFVESALFFITKFEYDGLDLDWEFPKEEDKANFVKLLSELSEAFQPFDILLTAAVRAIPIYDNSGYNVPEMGKYLNIINIMTYDFYGGWSDHTGFNSPLYAGSQDNAYEKKYLNVEAALRNWTGAGAPKEKICIGIPFYGRTFLLAENQEHGVHAKCLGAGKPVAATYYQIMKNYAKWNRVWDDEQKAPYKYSLDHWIGYDDEQSVHEKVKFALKKDVAGVFVWQLGGDDLAGDVPNESKQHLLKKIYDQFIEAQEGAEDGTSEHGSEPTSESSMEHVFEQVSGKESAQIEKGKPGTSMEDVE